MSDYTIIDDIITRMWATGDTHDQRMAELAREQLGDLQARIAAQDAALAAARDKERLFENFLNEVKATSRLDDDVAEWLNSDIRFYEEQLAILTSIYAERAALASGGGE